MAVAAAAEAAGEAPPLEAVREAQEDLPPPLAPGLDEANLTVYVATEPKTETAKATQEAGVEHLMQQPCGTILGLMARDGWEVNLVDGSQGLYEVIMPSVRYSLPLATVSMESPRFKCQVLDSCDESIEGYRERLRGDLVMQNGHELLQVELRLFGRRFSVSAAGWARCRVGQEGSAVRMQVEVKMGLEVPRVPGMASIMEFFVKTYANQSTQDCARALAKGADELPSREE